MVFPWSLSDSNFSQVSRTLFSILADLNNAVVWMVSTRPLISKSSSPSINLLVTVPNYNWYYRHFHVPFFFFRSLAILRHLSLFSLSFNFTFWLAETTKSTIWPVLFIFCWLSFGLVVWPTLGDEFLLQNPKKVCASHSPGRIPVCKYTICLYSQI